MGTNKQRRDIHISCIEFFDVHSLCCCHVRIKKSNIYHGGGGGGTALQFGTSEVRSRWGHLDFSLTKSLWPWGKGSHCKWLTTLPHLYADCLEIWEPQAPGAARACPCL